MFKMLTARNNSHRQQLAFMLILLIAFSIFTIFRQPLISALILFMYLLYTLRSLFLPDWLSRKLGGVIGGGPTVAGAAAGKGQPGKPPRTPAPGPTKDPVAERHKKRALELLDQRMAAMNGKGSPFIV